MLGGLRGTVYFLLALLCKDNKHLVHHIISGSLFPGASFECEKDFITSIAVLRDLKMFHLPFHAAV